MIFTLFKSLVSQKPSSSQLEADKSRQDLKPAIQEAQATANLALLQPPVGSVTGWAGSTDPPGGMWLICDGRLLDGATYPVLFDTIGQAFNTGGESAGQFRVPDMRGRVSVGAGPGTGLTNRAVAAKFGAETHALSIAELASHNHTASGGNHSHGASFFGGSHSHGGVVTNVSTNSGSFAFGSSSAVTSVFESFGSTNSNTTSGSVAISSEDVTPTIANTGSGTAHNNMQPSLAMHNIIRVL